MMPSMATAPTPAALPKPAKGNLLVRLLQNLWFTSTTYLPVLLIVTLALGTWWLARNTPGVSLPSLERPLTHEPDYFMRDFAVKTFDATGKLISEVAGTEGRHFPDTDVLEVDKARVKSFKNNQTTNATANRAYTNGNATEVQLVGNAVVVREAGKDATGNPQPRMEFKGEFLHVFINTEQVKSNKPVVITRGKDRFVADNLAYDNLDRVVAMQGRVKVTLHPQPAP